MTMRRDASQQDCLGMNTDEVVAAIAVAENGQDWAALAALFAEDVTIVHPGLGPVPGREANVAVMQLILGAISGYTRSNDGLVIDGERGAFRFAITGTHTGDLPGFPATGEPVEISGAMHFVVRDGQLAEAVEILNHDSIRGVSLR
jgi:ketosteroid isomerase-like protein